MYRPTDGRYSFKTKNVDAFQMKVLAGWPIVVKHAGAVSIQRYLVCVLSVITFVCRIFMFFFKEYAYLFPPIESKYDICNCIL